MPLSPLPGAYSQVSWPGVGDIDDCWVLAPFWALVASRACTKAQLPTVARFRNAAGVPEKPTTNGGSNAQALRAVKSLFPKAGAYSYVGAPLGFFERIDKGEVGSVSLVSAKLPLSMRHGFLGFHQVAVAKSGGNYVMMNPLQTMGTKPYVITKSALTIASVALYGDGKFHAVMFPDHVPPVPVDPTIALKAEITSLKAQLAARDATIAGLTAKINAVRTAIL